MKSDNIIEYLPDYFDNLILVLDEDHTSGVLYISEHEYHWGCVPLSHAIRRRKRRSIIVDGKGNYIEQVGVKVIDKVRFQFHRMSLYLFAPKVKTVNLYDASTSRVIERDEFILLLNNHIQNYLIPIYEDPDIYTQIQCIINSDLPIKEIMRLIHIYECTDISIDDLLSLY